VSAAVALDRVEVPASRQRLVAAELLKVTSTKMWLGFLVGVVLYIGIGIVAVVFTPAQPGVEVPTLETDQGIRNLLAQAGGAYVFAIVLGALGMTQEIRHQTLTSTFLAEPRRNRVMVAKMAAYGIVGAAYGAVGVAFGYLLAVALLPLKEHAPIPWDVAAQIAGGAILGSALFAILGVAIGTLIRNQIAAILLVLVWVLLIEALVVAFLPDWGKWLPGGALAGVLQSTGFGGAEYLSVWQGSLVLIAYAVVFGALAALTTQRRDVT
jgi:ABC-type transport system involved in multi-copper enzyme maturation permease subunit